MSPVDSHTRVLAFMRSYNQIRQFLVVQSGVAA